MVQTIAHRHAPHMVHHHRQGEFAEKFEKLRDIPRIQMQHQMPTHGRDARGGAPYQRQIRHAPQMLHKAEAHSAHAAFMQGAERDIIKAFINQGHTAPAAIAPRNAIQHGTIIGLIDRGLHNHRAIRAKPFMQGNQIIAGAFRRRIGCALGDREAIKRAPDMHMRIAGTARQKEGRFAHCPHNHMALPSRRFSSASHRSGAGQTSAAGTATAPCIRRRALR